MGNKKEEEEEERRNKAAASMSKESGFDRYLTIFSPEGRLYQVEYSVKAVKSPGLTSVGLRGEDCVVVVAQKKVPDKLIDPSSVTHLFNVTPHIGCLMTGLVADGRSMVTQARQEAAEFEYKNGFLIPASVLANRVADMSQANTQHAGRRMMAADMMLCSVDDESGPQLFLVDPAGHYFSYKGCASGAKAQEATSLLERRVAEDPTMSTSKTIQTAIMTLQTTVSADFKANEIEVGVVEGKKGKFTRLSEDEIDQHLTAIVERD